MRHHDGAPGQYPASLVCSGYVHIRKTANTWSGPLCLADDPTLTPRNNYWQNLSTDEPDPLKSWGQRQGQKSTIDTSVVTSNHANATEACSYKAVGIYPTSSKIR